MKKKIAIIVFVLIAIVLLYPFASKKISEYIENKRQETLIKEAYDLYDSKEYLSAYNIFINISDRTMVDKCAIELVRDTLHNKYEYDVIENLSYNRISDEVYNVVLDYLREIKKPTKEEAEMPLKILKACGKNEGNDDVYRCLTMISEIENMIIKEDVVNISSTEYHLDNHPLDGHSRITSSEGYKGFYWSNKDVGFGFNFNTKDAYGNSEIGEFYYLIYGDYSDYYWFQSSDGNWFYGIKDNQLIRMNEYGDIQVIDSYAYDVDCNNCFGWLYDGNLLFVSMPIEDKTIIYRYYISENLKASITLDTPIEEVFTILYPNSGEIFVRIYDPDFMEYVNKIKADKSALYNILLNYHDEATANKMAYETDYFEKNFLYRCEVSWYYTKHYKEDIYLVNYWRFE